MENATSNLKSSNETQSTNVISLKDFIPTEEEISCIYNAISRLILTVQQVTLPFSNI